MHDLKGFDIVFPREYLRAALMVSLLSVWVLVGLFYYLNLYTKRRYFTIWTAAWLFYALWLTLGITVPAAAAESFCFRRAAMAASLFLRSSCCGAVCRFWSSAPRKVSSAGSLGSC